jgi:hypothetical protein
MVGSTSSFSATGSDWHLREEKVVIVDGVKEVWQLRWQSKPHSSCGSDLTCPCSGFAYGMKGKIALIRKRPGHPVESLNLASMFPAEYPNANDPNSPGEVTVQQWAPILEGSDTDWEHADEDGFEDQVRRRPAVDLMHFADYDHDGRATEFLIQVATLPCGKHQMTLVGISHANPRLHAFSTAEKPNTPLVLGKWEWDALQSSDGPVSVIDWNCDDHGSNVEWRMEMEANAGFLHAKNIGLSCPNNGLARTLVDTQIR